MRGLLIAGNWKMNHGPRDTGLFLSHLRDQGSTSLSAQETSLLQNGKVRACVIPPFISLEKAKSEALQLSFPLTVAAQNAHWEKKGAFTGETSGPMLKELGIHWVLVGHSERRQFFGETDASVHKRTLSLLEQGFHVILCVGETREERESGKTEAVLTRQLKEALPKLDHLTQYLNGQLILAYEPVWAIGTGLTATPEQAEEAHSFIRKFLKTLHSDQVSQSTPILYGGSVTPENAKSLLSCENVDGALVGGASLKPESFLSLIKTATQIVSSKG